MKSNFIMCVYGKKGSGKTYFTEYFIKQLNRVIVYDTMRNFDKDFEIIYSIKKFEKLVSEIADNEVIKFRISLRVSQDYFERVNRLLLNLKDFTYVVDEIQVYVTALSIPHYLNVLITESRHFQINQIYITQRPSRIPAIIMANADYLAIFETHLKKDLDTFSTYKYTDTESIRNLKDYEFYFVNLKLKRGGICKI